MLKRNLIVCSLMALLGAVAMGGCSGTPGVESPTPSGGTPTPTLAPTASPSPTNPPTPTSSPTPDISPTPVGTPTPGLTPTPTSTPTPAVDEDLDGFTSLDGDCDDTDDTIYPGAPELADGKDNNCNDQIDEGLSTSDADGDGFSPAQGDCNDSDLSIYPGANEIAYDGIDQDCVGGDLVDVDDDGYNGVQASGTDELDCDDDDAAVYPGAPELCNDLDDDCDDDVDEDALNTFYQDNDQDGVGSAVSVQACNVPVGYVVSSGDCNDSDDSINPAAAEVCNAKDDDCDGLVDDADSNVSGQTTWYKDQDLDGFGDKNALSKACTQPTGYVSTGTDCNDADAQINPSATEVCNGKDDDCDNLTDDADPTVADQQTWYRDEDGDGFSSSSVSTKACTQPPGYIKASSQADCNDKNANINPSATEICDGADNNCNGQIDEGVSASTYYKDSDGDGYGDKKVPITTCIHPSGYVTNSTDCDDSNSSIYPGALEVCNGLDDDCDSAIDEAGAAESCPGEDTECASRSCSGGECGFSYADFGEPIAAQEAGDCSLQVCDGNGGTTSQNDDQDLPVDDNQCTLGACSLGSPSQLPVELGTYCNQDGGRACSAQATCLPVVSYLRLGDGAAALSSAATRGYVEYRLSNGAVMPGIPNPLTLPIAVDGIQQPITFSGTKTAEGGLSRSDDGRYLVLAGYAASPGTASVGTSATATVNRVVARVNVAGQIDTSTRLTTAFSGDSVRAASSSDGSSYWVSGTSGSSPSFSGGVHYIAHGDTGGIQLVTEPNNSRFTHVIDGQVYTGTASSPLYGIFTVGTGLPSTSGQVGTQLPGMPTAGGLSPYGFVLLDTDPLIPGHDRLYIADDRSVASGGGIQRWDYNPNGAIWELTITFATGGTAGARGIAAAITGDVVTIFASTAESTGNKIITLIDDGSPAPSVSVLATAATNTILRGVALMPE